MNTMQDILAQDRRLAILSVLNEAPGAQANEHVLRHGLEFLGHQVGLDLLCADIAWLEEHGLARKDASLGTVWVAKLTAAGADVAEGRSRHPGVARPEPD